MPSAPRQLGWSYRLSHLAGQGRAPASPSPAPTFEVNKWKRLSPPPSVTRLISAAHLSLRGTKGAQRRGQLRPALVRERGAVAPRARPTPLNTRGLAAGEASVAGAQLRRPHAQPRAEGRQAGGRRRLVTISARILTRQDLPWGGGAPGPRLQGEYPAPPPKPGPHLCLGLGSVEGGQQGLARAHAAVSVPNAHCSADPAGPGRSTRSRPYRR